MALRLKPIFEARARANHSLNGGDKSEAARLKSDTPVEKTRTDAAIAELANMGKTPARPNGR